jgi:5-methylthioadenosine/S-adenosylhomocysteine deaminase
MSDLLIVGGDVVTMDSARRVLTGATVAVSENSIAALGTAEELRARFPGAREIDATGCVVIPGLIDAHQHTTVDPLVRSMVPDSIGSQESIFDWIVPLHAHADGDDDELAATITAVECLSRGITTVLEPGTVAYPERVAAGLGAVGVRARVGGWGWDAKDVPLGAPAHEVLARQEDIVRSLPVTGPVTGWVTLVGHDLASDELFTGAASLAERLDTGLTWHISPGPADVEAYALRCGRRPVVHFRELGVLGPRLLLGHAVWLDDAEVDAILETGTSVASCPGACLRLAQGYTRASRHAELVRRGGRVALGCDAHNAGDAPDILLAAYLFAALERDRDLPDPIRAEQAFALATVDGAMCRAPFVMCWSTAAWSSVTGGRQALTRTPSQPLPPTAPPPSCGARVAHPARPGSRSRPRAGERCPPLNVVDIPPPCTTPPARRARPRHHR